MLFFKDEVSYILSKLRRLNEFVTVIFIMIGLPAKVRKKLLHQNTFFFFRIKFGKKLSNSLISGKTAYKFILKSEGQQSSAKIYNFKTADCCPDIYRNPIRATLDGILCFSGRPL